MKTTGPVAKQPSDLMAKSKSILDTESVSLNYRTFQYTAFNLYGKIFIPLGEIRIGQFKMPFSMERLIPFPKKTLLKMQ